MRWVVQCCFLALSSIVGHISTDYSTTIAEARLLEYFTSIAEKSAWKRDILWNKLTGVTSDINIVKAAENLFLEADQDPNDNRVEYKELIRTINEYDNHEYAILRAHINETQHDDNTLNEFAIYLSKIARRLEIIGTKPRCTNDFFSVGKYCYKVVNDSVERNYSQTLAMCKTFSAYLPVFYNDTAEWDDLYEQLSKRFVQCDNCARFVWLGLQRKSGKWFWDETEAHDQKVDDPYWFSRSGGDRAEPNGCATPLNSNAKNSSIACYDVNVNCAHGTIFNGKNRHFCTDDMCGCA